MSLEDLLSVKVTSSTLTDENLRSVPASMTVYTRADVRRLGLKSLGELVNYVPGFQSYRSDASSLNRTISARARSVGSSGPEILVLIDGQRLNNDWHGGAGMIESLVSLENIERIEFIRGPGSAIYGSNAMTGVINLITQSKRELLVESGNNQTHYASLQFHGEGESGSLDVYGRSARSDGEAQRVYSPTTNTHIYGRDPYRADDIYLRGNLVTELGEFSLAARATSRDTQEFYAVGYTDPNAYFDSRTDSLNAGWRHTLANSLLVEGHVFNSHKFYRGRAAITATGDTVYEGGIVERELGTQWTLQGGASAIRWLLGWEWRNPELTDTSSHLGTLANPYAISPLISQALENDRVIQSEFLQLQIALNERLELTTGLRHDNYSDVGGHYSPRIALVQQLDSTDTLKLLYSEAFRAPSRLESSVINQVTVVQNPDLQAETAKTAELIWVHLFDAGLASATLFNTQVDDAIVNSVVSMPSLKRKPINSDLSVAGLELEWQQQWSSQWQSRIAFTHIFDPVGDIHTQSNNLFGGSLSYERNPWTATLLANYQGSVVDPNEQDRPANISTTEITRLGGYTLYSLHLNYQLATKLDLHFHIDNLFNKNYFSSAFRPANYEGVPGTGRVYMLGANWSY
jgi:outer membrane receptor for ferrienterochelin and colicin